MLCLEWNIRPCQYRRKVSLSDDGYPRPEGRDIASVPHIKLQGSTITDHAPSSGGSPLVRSRVVDRTSAAPDRDRRLHLLPCGAAIRTSDSASLSTNVSIFDVLPAVGFIPSLKE